MNYQDSESVRLPNFSGGGFTQTRTRGTLSPQRANDLPEVNTWLKKYAGVIPDDDAMRGLKDYLTLLLKQGRELPEVGIMKGPLTARWLQDFEKRSLSPFNAAGATDPIDIDLPNPFNVSGVMDPIMTTYR